MNNIRLGRANEEYINRVMNIIEVAQEDFRIRGIDQWQGNYPNHEVIRGDIENNNAYVLKKGEEIVGTVAIIFDEEVTYNRIYNGDWLSYGDYAVIHRMAIDFNYRGSGLASLFIREIEKLSKERGIYSVRVDTHRENVAMRRLLTKEGYSQCGIIYLVDKSERIAFEKLLI